MTKLLKSRKTARQSSFQVVLFALRRKVKWAEQKIAEYKAQASNYIEAKATNELGSELQKARLNLLKTEWLGIWGDFDLRTPWFFLEQLSSTERRLLSAIERNKKRIEKEENNLDLLKLKSSKQAGSIKIQKEMAVVNQKIVSFQESEQIQKEQFMSIYLQRKFESERTEVLRISATAKEYLSPISARVIAELQKRKANCDELYRRSPVLIIVASLPFELRRFLSKIWLQDCVNKMKIADEILERLLFKSSENSRLILHFEAHFTDEPGFAKKINDKLQELSQVILAECGEISDLLSVYSSTISIVESEGFLESANAALAKGLPRTGIPFSIFDKVEAEVLRREEKASLTRGAYSAAVLTAPQQKKILQVYQIFCGGFEQFFSDLEVELGRFHKSAHTSDELTINGLDEFCRKLCHFVSLEDEMREKLSVIRRGADDAKLLQNVCDAEERSYGMFCATVKAYELLDCWVNKFSSEILRELDPAEIAVKELDSIREKAECFMLTLLHLLDSILAHQVWLRSDIYFWRHFASSEDRQNNNNSIALEIFAKKHFELLESKVSVVDQFVEKYRDLRMDLKEAMVLADIHEPFDDRLFRLDCEIRLDRLTIEPIDISNTLSKLEPGINRIIDLLARFEKIAFYNEQNSTFISSENATLIINNRDECKAILAELVTAESALKNVIKRVLESEFEKRELWQRRVIVAEKVGNKYLALRARRRQEQCEKVLSCLEPNDNLQQSGLPTYFENARIIVERVEQQCGLVPNPILKENSRVFAISLFDRVFFLLENLIVLLDAEETGANALLESK